MKFAITPIRAASIVLEDAAGKPLPVGSQVRLHDGAGEPALVGFDGVVYLDTLDQHNMLDVDTPSGPCHASFDYHKQGDGIPPDRTIDLQEGVAMNTRLLHYVVTLLLIGCAWFWIAPAHATITCSTTSMSAVSFGTVNPLSSLTQTTATLSYTCKNSAGAAHSATLCFSIGEPGGNQTNPRLMKSGTNTLQFQLYWGSFNGTIWGSQFFGSNTPLVVNLSNLAGNATTNGTATLYAQVLAAQTTAIPSVTQYADDYANGDTALTINDQAGATAPGACGGTEEHGLFPI